MKMWWLLLCFVSVTLQQRSEASEDPPHVHIVENVDLGFKGDLALSSVETHKRTIICVVNSWALHREGQGEFRIEDIDATLCTHLMIRSLEMEDVNGTGNFVFVNKDLSELESNKVYRKAVGLKKQNPKLKVIFSVGGWFEGVKDFQTISSDFNIRTKFGTYLVNYLKDKKLDGVNVEWVWPGASFTGGKSSDQYHLTLLIASLSAALKAEEFELGVTLPASIGKIVGGFDLQALQINLDYFILMGEALTGYWNRHAGHHSALLPLTGTTVGKTVKFVLNQISPQKVILGIPFAGKTFELRNAGHGGSGLGARTVTGQGMQGTFNNHHKDDKVVNYNEICSIVSSRGSRWRVYDDSDAKVPFMRDRKGNWVSFDDAKSVQSKVEFGEKLALGGYAAWSITSDDFRGNLCGGGIKYPLLRTINYVLSIFSNTSSITTARDILDVTTTPTVDGGSEITTGTDGHSFSSVVSYVTLTLMILLLVALLLLVVWKRREKMKGGNEGGLSSSEISRFKQGYTSGAAKERTNAQAIIVKELQGDDINCNPYDNCLEIPKKEYELYADDILGSGAYGVVVKGKVRNEVVAVKTVKPLSSKEYVLSLLEEIKVMTYLGKHEHILGLIGADTALLRRGIVYVFVELCPLGSLEKYLKDNKSKFVDLMQNDMFTCEVSRPKDDAEGMSSATLLIWARQISNAMQFLGSKNVIHGDLATRNVLLRGKHLVKISDFGLSRKMYAYCNYIKQKQEPLPWRYMSLEALKNMEFSTKSDVWAFGVTLWEIFTLGDVPYPGMSYTLGFVDDLLGGLRLAKPRHATTELYENTMLQTWNENSKDRPSFEELSVFLGDAVERITFQQEYMNVNNYTN